MKTLRRRCPSCLRITAALTCPCGAVLATPEHAVIGHGTGLLNTPRANRATRRCTTPCSECGDLLVDVGASRRYCDDCRAERIRQQHAEVDARRRGKAPPLEVRCVDCAVSLTPARPRRGRPRVRCATCQRRVNTRRARDMRRRLRPESRRLRTMGIRA